MVSLSVATMISTYWLEKRQSHWKRLEHLLDRVQNTACARSPGLNCRNWVCCIARRPPIFPLCAKILRENPMPDL